MWSHKCCQCGHQAEASRKHVLFEHKEHRTKQQQLSVCHPGGPFGVNSKATFSDLNGISHKNDSAPTGYYVIRS